MERYYFKALYFREPNGILFELSTDGPGFAVDESIDEPRFNLFPPMFQVRRQRKASAELIDRFINGKARPVSRQLKKYAVRFSAEALRCRRTWNIGGKRLKRG